MIKQRLLQNLTGMKMLAVYLWLLAVVVPTMVGYMAGSPRVTEDLATLVVQITAGLIGALMGMRVWTDVASMRNGTTK